MLYKGHLRIIVINPAVNSFYEYKLYFLVSISHQDQIMPGSVDISKKLMTKTNLFIKKIRSTESRIKIVDQQESMVLECYSSEIIIKIHSNFWKCE